MTATLVVIGVIIALALVEWAYEQHEPPAIRDFHSRTRSDEYARACKGGA